LTLQAQALSTLANNPMISLQQLGLEGIMGQPNLAQFAAAASSVLSGAPFSGISLPAQPTAVTSSRTKYNRLSNAPASSTTSMAQLSSSAKRTRLDGASSAGSSFSNAANSLPAGARGQNLVSLVSPTDPKSSQGRPSASPQKSDSHSSHSRTALSSSSRAVYNDRSGSDRLSVPPKSTATGTAKSTVRPSSCAPKSTPKSFVTVATVESNTASKQDQRGLLIDVTQCSLVWRLVEAKMDEFSMTSLCMVYYNSDRDDSDEEVD
uniref:CG18389 n=1 Tax=Echinostoma caproni TaxID=27848 RepID=A0A183BCI3_9TREM